MEVRLGKRGIKNGIKPTLSELITSSKKERNERRVRARIFV